MVVRTKSLHNDISVNVTGMLISLLHCVKSLDVISDENLKFNAHVSAVCKVCFFHIRALHHIRMSMSTETAKMVACTIRRRPFFMEIVNVLDLHFHGQRFE